MQSAIPLNGTCRADLHDELVARAVEPVSKRVRRRLLRLESWASKHARALKVAAFIMLGVFLTTALFCPSIAYANIITDIAGFFSDPLGTINRFLIVDLFGGAVCGMLNFAVDLIANVNVDSVLTSDFTRLLGEGGGIAGVAEVVSNSVVRPCANVILSLVVLVQLFKIASEMDRQGGTLPGVREVAKLFVMLAIFLYLVNNSFGVMTGVFDLVQRIVRAINNLLSFDGVASHTPFSAEAIFAPNVDNINIGDMLLLLVISLITMLMSVIALVVSQFAALGRALEIYFYTMFSPLPFSFLGFDETRSWAIGYLRNFVAACLAGAIIIATVYCFPFLVNDAIANATLPPDALVSWTNFFWIFKLIAAELILITMLAKSGSFAQRLLGGV